MDRRLILTCLFFLLPTSVLAAQHPVDENNLAAYKELSQVRTDALKESLQKDIQAQTARIDAQDKRVERQDKLLDSFSARIGDLSFTLTVAGFILTMAGLAAGLLGYFTVSSRAKNEARIAASEWMEKEGQIVLAAKLQELDLHIDAQKKAATAKVEKFDGELEQLRTNAAMPIAALQKQMSEPEQLVDFSVQEQTAQANIDAISQLVEALKHKPEAEYGFDDWNVRAHDSYTKGNFALAAEYWLQAARGGKGSGAEVAQSLFNAGVALSQTGRSQEAIDVYSEVVLRYGSAPELALREQVAQSLTNKGYALADMKRSEEAMESFTKVISLFGNASELPLFKMVVFSLLGKARLLNQSDSCEKALETCDEALSKCENAPEAELRSMAAHALNAKGYVFLCRAKANWNDEAARTIDLQTAYGLFDQAAQEIDNKPIVYGNQAYTAFLLGQQAASRPLLIQALQQSGEELYRITLDDLDVHPVPADIAFRALLDEVWDGIKQKV
jgi:tetratricopeptide (TPR) repeat protein